VSEQEKLRTDVLTLASTAWKDLLKPKLVLLEEALLNEVNSKTGQISQEGAIGQERLKVFLCVLAMSFAFEVWPQGAFLEPHILHLGLFHFLKVQQLNLCN
jgi:hypothetical protein